MPSLIAVLASIAVAGGFGTLIGIMVTGRIRRPVNEGAGVPLTVEALRTAPSRDISARVPKGYLRILEHRIALAGRPQAWTVGRILVAKPLFAASGAVVAIWWASGDPGFLRIALGIALVVLCFFVPDLLLYSRGQERQSAMQDALADTLDQMTIAVEAGLGFEAAMAKAATNGKGPLAEEFIRTLQDMSIGRSRKDAYLAFAKRTSSADLHRFTRSVVQADTYGIAIAAVLRVQAAEMRLRRRQRAEEKAMKIPIKVLFPLVFCILPVLFIVLLTPAVLNIIKAFS